MFENAATHSYARSTLEKKKELSSLSGSRDLLGEISDKQRVISTHFEYN
jgi:hypothetical protein